MAGPQRSIAAPRAAASTEGETDHFWYRLAPADPYIDSQRENKAFGFRGREDFSVGRQRSELVSQRGVSRAQKTSRSVAS